MSEIIKKWSALVSALKEIKKQEMEIRKVIAYSTEYNDLVKVELPDIWQADFEQLREICEDEKIDFESITRVKYEINKTAVNALNEEQYNAVLEAITIKPGAPVVHLREKD